MSNLKEARKPAPTVVAGDPFADPRRAIVDKLDAENPEYKHLFQSSKATKDELERKHQEVVKDENGNEVKLDGDIVVRVLKQIWDGERELRQDRSRRTAMRIFNKNADEVNKVAIPKTPKPIGEIKGD